MLVELAVDRLAIVETARLEPAAGFTALTGETGAGKSLLVGALTLLVGGRADPDAIRAGESRARVEGRFQLADGPARVRASALLESWGIAFDDEIVIRREIVREGRSRAWVNQAPVTLAALAMLGDALLDVHGQHEHQSLLSSDRQRELLDRWAGLEDARAEHGALFAAWRAAAFAVEDFAVESARFAAEADHWAFVHEELTRAALVLGEDDALAVRLARLRHAGRLTQALARARAALAGADDDAGRGGALHDAAEAERALSEAGAIDPALAALALELAGARVTLGEVLRAVEASLDPEALDPAEAEAAEARHALIERLTRKHHRTLAELIAWRDELGVRLTGAGDSAAERARLEASERDARSAQVAAARALTKKRQAAAAKLAKALPAELEALGLERAKLSIAFESVDPPTSEGADRVEFRFAPNAGEDARPLAKIASGGELSRVMLALKTLLAAQDGVDTLLFDEVDAGIGGAVARAVGERLAALGAVRQVLCVTHLPVIAAQADRQFAVAKETAAGRTRATVTRVEGEARIEELARMLAGDAATATTRRQARELLGLRA
jgi:DNA repair protein RecN (Recombination protein N)